MISGLRGGAIGTAVERVEARAKVTGEARYAYEYDAEGVAHASIVQSTIARGEIRVVDATAALALPGVLAVISHQNAPVLGPIENGELLLFQSPRVAYRGQVVAAVVAERFEIAREAAALVKVEYDAEPHDVVLRADHPDLFKPELAAGRTAETSHGDVEAALAAADVVVDRWYSTPAAHQMPMEPHASLAAWSASGLTLYDGTQFTHGTRAAIARLFELAIEEVRVISHHVGGGFGSKGSPRPQAVIAVMAARVVGRPVKIALTRRQMFPIAGHRSPTLQRVRLGADADARLTAWEHEALAQTSTLNEFCEPATTGTRHMYAAPNRFNTHQLVRLDVPSPGFCRAPGEAPGFFATESAIDELASECGVDPVELRVRNEPEADPDSGLPFSSRGLVECLTEGAARFGWAERRSRARRDGRRLVGTGVASSFYPTFQQPSQARARVTADADYVVQIAASDVGTGARTALAQIAAEQLDVPLERVRLELGDSSLPYAIGAFGSQGTAAWGHAVDLACRRLRERLDEHGGVVPAEGLEVHADTTDELQARAPYSRSAYGAQFAEVHVDVDSGEIRVSQLLGVFGVGRVVNPVTARSQLIGGMTWGISMALLEESVLDPAFGDYVANDLASYHVAAAADVPKIEVAWLDEVDPHIGPVGAKGIGEIGIVGTAAAIANAVSHATGVRVRELPIKLEDVLA
jgi:xanthine dehydrogenase YagR molybdenum-binding subunit